MMDGDEREKEEEICEEFLEEKELKHKPIWERILLIPAALGIGLGVQVVGDIIATVLGIGELGILFVLLGFAVMGILIYKWAIR
jgi:hypothetical protein